MGAEVTFLTVAGADEAASFAAETLDAFGVDHAILADPSRPTTRKQRFRVDGRMAMRLSHLRQHDVAGALRDRLTSHALSGCRAPTCCCSPTSTTAVCRSAWWRR